MVTKSLEARLSKMVTNLAKNDHQALIRLLEKDEKLAKICMSQKDLRMLEDASGRVLSQELVRLWKSAALMSVENQEIAFETNKLGKFGWPVLFSALRSWEEAALKLLEYPDRAALTNELTGTMAIFDAVRYGAVAREVAANHKSYLSLRSGFIEHSLREHIKDIHGVNFFRGKPSQISDEAVKALTQVAREL